MIYFIYFKDKVIYIEREAKTENERDFPLIGSLPKWLQWQGLPGQSQEPGSGSSKSPTWVQGCKELGYLSLLFQAH